MTKTAPTTQTGPSESKATSTVPVIIIISIYIDLLTCFLCNLLILSLFTQFLIALNNDTLLVRKIHKQLIKRRGLAESTFSERSIRTIKNLFLKNSLLSTEISLKNVVYLISIMINLLLKIFSI